MNKEMLEEITAEYLQYKQKQDQLQAELEQVDYEVKNLHDLSKYINDDVCPFPDCECNFRYTRTYESRCRNFVLDFLEKGGCWSCNDITNTILDAGWKTDSREPSAVVRSCLHRMVKKNFIIRKDGLYSL